MRKRILISLIVVICIAIAGLTYNYVFSSEHRNIANEAATVFIDANELHLQFVNDESLATTKYLDKVIQVEGTVTSVEINSCLLDTKIDVSFTTEIAPIIDNGALLKLKGRCVGYDELLEVVKIDQAIVINN